MPISASDKVQALAVGADRQSGDKFELARQHLAAKVVPRHKAGGPASAGESFTVLGRAGMAAQQLEVGAFGLSDARRF